MVLNSQVWFIKQPMIHAVSATSFCLRPFGFFASFKLYPGPWIGPCITLLICQTCALMRSAIVLKSIWSEDLPWVVDKRIKNALRRMISVPFDWKEDSVAYLDVYYYWFPLYSGDCHLVLKYWRCSGIWFALFSAIGVSDARFSSSMTNVPG